MLDAPPPEAWLVHHYHWSLIAELPRRYLEAVSTPGLPTYGQHLTLHETVATLAPSAEAVAQATAWLAAAASGAGAACEGDAASVSPRLLHTRDVLEATTTAVCPGPIPPVLRRQGEGHIIRLARFAC